MKYILLLFFIATTALSGIAQTRMLTAKDKQNYVLSIDQRQIGKPKITEAGGKKYGQQFIPVKLTNNSNDTLKYITFSCSSEFIYQVDNHAIVVDHQPCQKNVPVVKKVPPHKSTVAMVPVKFTLTSGFDRRFKVGLCVKKYNDPKDVDFANLITMDKANVIWSNEAEVAQ
ncbi:MAG: hypothetical protein ACXVB0_14145 [Mucilaginibacter sp.]